MIEIAAVVFSLVSVYLGGKNNILTWPIGILGITMYSILFYNSNVFGNALLQIIFLIQSIYGWSKWNNDRKIGILPINKSIKNILLALSTSLIISYILYISGSKNSLFDGFTTGLSIIALILMIYKKIDCWYYWIIIDILFVVFFIKLELYLSSITYFIFLLLAIWGLKKWNQIIKMD